MQPQIGSSIHILNEYLILLQGAQITNSQGKERKMVTITGQR